MLSDKVKRFVLAIQKHLPEALYTVFWEQVNAIWHIPFRKDDAGRLTSSASLKEKRESSVAMVATRETLARDCPTQLRGPSAKGK